MTVDTAFTHFPILETNRLRLRQIQASDAPACYQMKSDPLVTKPYAQEPHQSLDDTQAWIKRLQTAYKQRQAIFWCLTQQGQNDVIGACTFWNFDSDYHCAEIGYELNRKYWQKGFMSEALKGNYHLWIFRFGLASY